MTAPGALHPSPLALDRVALGARDPEVARHATRCPRCAAHLEAARAAPPAAGWLDGVRVAPAPPRPRRPRWRRGLPLLALATAAGLVLALRAAPPSTPEAATLRAKGVPAVVLYVKHGDAVAAWDGLAPVRPGDSLRLAVNGAGLGFVSVASLPPGGTPQILYEGPLAPDAQTLLPVSFRVDREGTAETLSVVVDDAPVEPGAHAAPSPPAAWSRRMIVPKETAP